MFIRHNIAAMNTTRQLGIANKSVSKHTERLSTSLQINRASDDVAGLAISEKMRAQIAGLAKASKNTQDSISLIQTAEGALNEVHNILTRSRELAVQAANDTNTADDRQQLQQELRQLYEEIDHIGQVTQFNTMKLFDGSITTLTLQLGANKDQTHTIALEPISTMTLGLTQDFQSQANAEEVIRELDEATNKVSTQRSQLGAWQNGFEHHITNVAQTGENLSAANSVIRDANVAFDVMEMTKESILQQTMHVAMTHSNVKNDWVLNILQ